MNKVYRVYSEKKVSYSNEAKDLLKELHEQLKLGNLKNLRIMHRYDVQGINEKIFNNARWRVFSKKPCDNSYLENLPPMPFPYKIIAVEALEGQFDQRADACAQCLHVYTKKEKPRVKYAKIYVLFGSLTDEEIIKIKDYLINPIESKESSMEKPESLKRTYKTPEGITYVDGLINADEQGLKDIIKEKGLAMDLSDLAFLQKYFQTEKRDPTITELRVLDTYWSDHCRHTTFSTSLENIKINDPRIEKSWQQYLTAREELYGDNIKSKPITLMDIATCAAKVLDKRGDLPHFDKSEEVNACSLKITATVDGAEEEWLLMFKNETHNHPTEMEPFGGAGTCVGGAIRDPLSGRAYVYQAMRITGSGDPTVPISETLPGKLPQRKITTVAADGNSIYGNQIGITSSFAKELYHPGYVAKRMELGALVGAVPFKNVRREEPQPGDIVLTIGGKTGRDGCGGATGSSQEHDDESFETCAAEVQKGDAPEERKIQRLMRKPEFSKLIKRCNDLGAGGYSVAIGELADGVKINLDRIPTKYKGLSVTELAISESQERMAMVVEAKDVDKFCELAKAENLLAVPLAEITKEPRLVIQHKDYAEPAVNISREFLNSNGAKKHTDIIVEEGFKFESDAIDASTNDILADLDNMLDNLSFCSQRGIGEKFDGSVGGNSVFMPLGGKYQRTPSQVMSALLPALGETDDCSVMAYGYDPYLSSNDPFGGSTWAVVNSVSKLVAAGCAVDDAYLTFQEYFPGLQDDPKRWGLPFAALLGALDAQFGLNIASIGGKDSMSGSFMDLDVPPTLVSFAICHEQGKNLISPEFKKAGNYVYLYQGPQDKEQGPNYVELKKQWQKIRSLIQDKSIVAAHACEVGGVLGGLFEMTLGNKIGFEAADWDKNFDYINPAMGSIIVESNTKLDDALLLGKTIPQAEFIAQDKIKNLDALVAKWESKLESVFPTTVDQDDEKIAEIKTVAKTVAAPKNSYAQPMAIVPVFPGTNGEYETLLALEKAGAKTKTTIIRNLNAVDLEDSINEFAKDLKTAQMLVLPAGYACGGEPEGAGKFIAAILNNKIITEAISQLLNKNDGLILGLGDGFQGLINCGLLPFGKIASLTDDAPALTFNKINRHQGCYVNTKIINNNSPWLSQCKPGEIYTVPFATYEGRFKANEKTFEELAKNGQIAAQYCDFEGKPSMDIAFNPANSEYAIESISSSDGRILGKMGHSERFRENIAKNIKGNKNQPIFAGGVNYFK